jgi:hypothetical protein
MTEIKGDLRYLQIPLGYLRNIVAELIKNQYDLLFYYIGYLNLFIVLFLFCISNFYVDCICSGIVLVYKLIFQYFKLVLCNNNSE